MNMCISAVGVGKSDTDHVRLLENHQNCVSLVCVAMRVNQKGHRSFSLMVICRVSGNSGVIWVTLIAGDQKGEVVLKGSQGHTSQLFYWVTRSQAIPACQKLRPRSRSKYSVYRSDHPLCMSNVQCICVCTMCFHSGSSSYSYVHSKILLWASTSCGNLATLPERLA